MSRIKSAHPVNAQRRDGQVVITLAGVTHTIPTWTFLELMEKCLRVMQALEREKRE